MALKMSLKNGPFSAACTTPNTSAGVPPEAAPTMFSSGAYSGCSAAAQAVASAPPE